MRWNLPERRFHSCANKCVKISELDPLHAPDFLWVQGHRVVPSGPIGKINRNQFHVRSILRNESQIFRSKCNSDFFSRFAKRRRQGVFSLVNMPPRRRVIESAVMNFFRTLLEQDFDFTVRTSPHQPNTSATLQRIPMEHGTIRNWISDSTKILKWFFISHCESFKPLLGAPLPRGLSFRFRSLTPAFRGRASSPLRDPVRAFRRYI